MMECTNRLPIFTPVLRFRPGGHWAPLFTACDSRISDSRGGATPEVSTGAYLKKDCQGGVQLKIRSS